MTPVSTVLLLAAIAHPLVRPTEAGPVRGIAQPATKTWAWLGVPYAKPPVGALRWRAPERPVGWTSPRDAAHFGSACAQIATFQGPPSPMGEPVGSEDCLTLNVWRPATKEKLPTLVFIHGGSNVAGYSGDPLYDGAELAARARAVVVSVNYRLGVFGWFAHPSLRTGTDALTDSGNLTLLDLVAALRFVKASIAGFGGDPENITVMGQSAGAVNTYSLMMSPLAAGLMTRAIVLTGARLSKPSEDREAYAKKVFHALLERTGAPSTDDPEAQRALLLAQDTATLLKAASGVPSPGWASADGAVIPKDAAAAIAARRFANIPLLVGLTRDEGKFFVPDTFRVSESERIAAMEGFDPDHPPPAGLALTDLIKDPVVFAERSEQMNQWIVGMVDRTLGELGPKLDRLYVMRFDWAEQVEPWRTILGASHAMELPFVFHNFGRNYFSCAFGRANRPGREALSRVMIASIAAFIRTSDPNTPALGLRWRPWRPEAPSRLVWNADARTVRLSIVAE
ncbi:MAG: carboxylesterase family protein [Myxococcales bacterium]|nr:carboxylesterase family protein [Myxococcales bacterium]MCB9650222.1 carboxylesterase family protein [Deltaproteobacteria bacterium]